MKQLRLWTARIFSAVLLLALGSAWQPVVAQDDGPAEGYYFIYSAVQPIRQTHCSTTTREQIRLCVCTTQTT